MTKMNTQAAFRCHQLLSTALAEQSDTLHAEVAQLSIAIADILTPDVLDMLAWLEADGVHSES